MKTQALPRIRRKDSDDRTAIVAFFLNIFRQHTAGGKECRCDYALIEVKDDEYIYNLNVHYKEKQQKRRMSVYHLSENSGSKSKCFKVVYDTLLVVKIPPLPIKNFEEYIRSIDAERRIANVLTPELPCVAPLVSTILKKIHPFSRDAHLPPENFEQKCIQRLRSFPQFQKHLQIGDSFAFFMDLSRHSFLSQVIQNIHSVEENLQREINSQTESLWDLMVFEDIYGDHTASVFYQINDVYRDFENRLTRLLEVHQPDAFISIYKKKEWFLHYLAGDKIADDPNEFSQAFIYELNYLLEDLFKTHYAAVEAYRRTISVYIHGLVCKQNRPKQQILINQILSMLDQLHNKGVALRDLKPDNIFVVEHTENALISLTHVDDISIGLIDFETAVRFKSQFANKIEQPLLAGTPSYATPSHLFPNELLSDAFQDMSRIFHIQDWQAVVAIIYNIATGEFLAEKTSCLIPGMIKMMRSPKMREMTLTELFKKGSYTFWRTAVNEFSEKLRFRKKMLQALTITLTPNARKMLKREAKIENERVNKQMWTMIDSQTYFKSRKSRKFLLDYSHAGLVKYRAKLESDAHILPTNAKVRRLVLKFIKDLEHLKLQSEQFDQSIARLDQHPAILSAYELLELMFNIVLKAMYLEEWGNLSLYISQFAHQELNGDLNEEAARVEKSLLNE